MKKIIFYFFFVFCFIVSIKGQSPKLTLEQLVGGVAYANRIYGVKALNDGETYAQLSPDKKRIVRYSFQTGKECGTLFDVSTAKGPITLNKIDGYTLSDDEKLILLQTQTKPIYRRSFTAEYYIYNVENKTFTHLSKNGAQQVPQFSPDGTMVAFSRHNNLFIVKLQFNNAEVQITSDGKFNEIINGTPDWVNEEEFSTNCSYCFTPDSKMLAWVRYDESEVPIYHMQMFKGLSPEISAHADYPGSYDYKYPIAGAKNSKVTVKSYDIASRHTRQLDVPLDNDGYIPRLFPMGHADDVAVITLNRHQSRMNLYKVNTRSTIATLLLEEKTEKYLPENSYTALTFYPNGFVLLSDRTGFKHLYYYTLQGTFQRALTQGDFDVTNFYGYDEKTGKTFFQAAIESPLRREVCMTDKKGKLQVLTPEKGTNTAIFSTNFKYYLHTFANTTTPTISSLKETAGHTLKTLIDNKDVKKKMNKVSGQQEFFTIQTTEGVTLNAWMMKPRNFDPAKKYPVIMYQYSGPGSQEVRDDWSIGFMGGAVFESYMAEKGFIFVIVDGRGTGYRGSEFEKCTYLKLGQIESHDQAEAALWLGKLPYVDKNRIGIWGWSFGGFNTLMAMSEGRGLFKAGVAVAAPTSWKYYDTVYTERYMRTPKENANYDINPIQRAQNLHGKLLLIHGTADDNVHYRNFAEYSEALVQAEKQFDMQLYTNRNHSIYGGKTRLHIFQRIADFFEKNL